MRGSSAAAEGHGEPDDARSGHPREDDLDAGDYDSDGNVADDDTSSAAAVWEAQTPRRPQIYNSVTLCSSDDGADGSSGESDSAASAESAAAPRAAAPARPRTYRHSISSFIVDSNGRTVGGASGVGSTATPARVRTQEGIIVRGPALGRASFAHGYGTSLAGAHERGPAGGSLVPPGDHDPRHTSLRRLANSAVGLRGSFLTRGGGDGGGGGSGGGGGGGGGGSRLSLRGDVQRQLERELFRTETAGALPVVRAHAPGESRGAGGAVSTASSSLSPSGGGGNSTPTSSAPGSFDEARALSALMHHDFFRDARRRVVRRPSWAVAPGAAGKTAWDLFVGVLIVYSVVRVAAVRRVRRCDLHAPRMRAGVTF